MTYILYVIENRECRPAAAEVNMRPRLWVSKMIRQPGDLGRQDRPLIYTTYLRIICAGLAASVDKSIKTTCVCLLFVIFREMKTKMARRRALPYRGDETLNLVLLDTGSGTEPEIDFFDDDHEVCWQQHESQPFYSQRPGIHDCG